MVDRPVEVSTPVGHVRGTRAGLAGWLALLTATIVVFTALGHDTLAAPDLFAPSTWQDWAAGRDTPTAVVAVLRLVVLALAWYLLVATAFAVLAHLTRRARLIRVADAVSVPWVRHLVRAGLGAGLAASVATTAASPALLHPPTALVAAADDVVSSDTGTSDAPTMTPLPPEVDSEPEPTPTAPRVIPPGMSGHDDPPEDAPAEQPTADDRPAQPAPTRSEHVVVAGDHLWSIAERTLAAHLGRPPTDDEVVPYWRRVIDDNRHRLADPDNPDLIFPGQAITLPDVSR